MRMPRLRRKYVVLPAAIVALSTLVAASAAPPPRCAADVAAEWAQSHRATLPTTLPEFSKYDAVYRHAIYHELTPAQRAGLWRRQLEPLAGSGSTLTAPQQAKVRLLLSRLDYYMTAPAAEARGALDRDGFSSAALRAEFGVQLGRAIFEDLGAPTRRNGGVVASEAAQARPGEARADAESASLAMVSTCHCSYDSDWCSGDNYCIRNGWECVHEDSCCGTIWMYECDGRCSTWM
jgi:hypothetical protein